MSDWPVMLKLRGRRVVVVGGGPVAARRVRTLLDAEAEVHVIAPDGCPAMEELAEQIDWQRRVYKPGDLARAVVVVIATDDAAVNEQVQRDAHDAGLLVNRADDPDAGDFIVPAHAHRGPLTVAVHTGGISAKAGATIRDAMLEALDADWITLLQTVAPFREQAQRDIADPAARQAALKALVDDPAMTLLKLDGVEALRHYCQQQIEAHHAG